MARTRGQASTLDSSRNPFELFVLVLGIISGAPLILGHIVPGSTAALLNPVLLVVWAVILIVGSTVALTGAFWPGRPHIGLLYEQFGLVITGVGVLIYTAGLLLTVQAPGRWLAAGLAGAYGLACFCRAWQIQRWVKVVLRLGKELGP